MLDDRKMRVLYAIIDSYISTGEPIGSRTITKKYDIGVSPATVRNEMSDLEELGYIGKAHSSSGRIPLDKAYRLHVDRFLQGDFLESMRFHQILTADPHMNEDQSKELIQTAVRMLTQWTQYMAIAAYDHTITAHLKQVQLVQVEVDVIIVMMTYRKGKTNHHIVHLPEPANPGDVKALEIRINQVITNQDFGSFEEVLPFYEKYPWMTPIIDLLNHERMIQEAHFVFDGLSNIYNFPEFSEAQKAKDFLQFFEDTGAITALFAHPTSSFEIRIGEENKEERLKETSVLTATYTMTEGTDGHIALIGPTRMNYAKALRAIYMITENLSKLYGTENRKGESDNG